MEKKLTKKKAKELAYKYLSSENEKIDPFHFVHTKQVVRIVRLLGKKKNIDHESLEIAAWVHDIGYAYDNSANRSPQHAKNTLRLLRDEHYEITSILSDCVLHHDGKGKPKTKEGILLQIAIKLNIFEIKFLEYLLNQQMFGIERNRLKARSELAIKMIEKYVSLPF
jgi:HD superfamily phosphodiesterase